MIKLPSAFNCSVMTLAIMLGACSSPTPKHETPAPAPASASTPTVVTEKANVVVPVVVGTQGQNQAQGAKNATTDQKNTAAPLPFHLDPKSAISLNRSVFFDFDDFSIKSDFMGMLEKHADYLRTKSELKIRVEGNADERGGAEYNLALGQKRAEAVTKALKILGVKSDQLEAISWGSEKPLAVGHEESAWSKNRRVDLQYPNK